MQGLLFHFSPSAYWLPLSLHPEEMAGTNDAMGWGGQMGQHAPSGVCWRAGPHHTRGHRVWLQAPLSDPKKIKVRVIIIFISFLIIILLYKINTFENQYKIISYRAKNKMQ